MPDSDPTVAEFLEAPLKKRIEFALDDSRRLALTALLGSDGYIQYRGIAEAHSHHLGASATNVIFLPGIMGSLLKSESRGGIWWIDVRTRRYIDRLRLGPSGLEDADVRDEIVASTTDIAYDPFLSVILERDDFGHRTFPYDWRKPPGVSSRALHDLIRNTYARNGHREVHLVAHSMGGLVLRAMLAEHGEDLRPILGRIVFIATPHYGSGAIAGYLKNHLWGFDLMALLGQFLSRETFRSLWGALSLLPAPAGVYPGTRSSDSEPWRGGRDDRYVHPCANFDMYDAREWQLDLMSEERSNLQRVLDGASEQHQLLFHAHRHINPDLRDRMLVIAGVGYKTLFRLRFDTAFWGLWEHTEKVTSRVAGDRHRDGDGSVPVASAELDNVTTRYTRGRHGEMPNLPRVYDEVFRWLKNDEPLQLDDTPAGALSRHLAGEAPSIAPFLDGTPPVASADDSGRWDETEDSARRDALLAKLDAEQLPDFARVKLL
jgi:pimeloyl-ACP methyl ester carboxylesterase